MDIGVAYVLTINQAAIV